MTTNKPKRKEIKCVGKGLVMSFVSRNNDLGGYWAIGILKNKVHEKGLSTLELDLTKGTVNFELSYSDFLIHKYQEKLKFLVAAKGFSFDPIKSAVIRLNFFSTEPLKFELSKLLGRGSLFTCIVDISDDLGRSYSYEYKGLCDFHDPKNERRRRIN